MNEWFEYVDNAAQRGAVVAYLGATMVDCNDEKARKIMRDMMQRLTDTIVAPKAKPESGPVLAYNGKPVSEN